MNFTLTEMLSLNFYFLSENKSEQLTIQNFREFQLPSRMNEKIFVILCTLWISQKRLVYVMDNLKTSCVRHG